MLDPNLDLILVAVEVQIKKTLEWLTSELNTIRAGRATPAMVEHVRIEYYGSQTPLSQMASVSAPQPDLLVIQPWDKSVLSPIEREISQRTSASTPRTTGRSSACPVPRRRKSGGECGCNQP